MRDFVGRISKTEFYGILSAFLALCLIASSARFYIRFYIHREIGWDDGFLLFGLCCLVSAVILYFTVVDTNFVLQGILLGEVTSVPSDLFAKALYCHKIGAICLTLIWASICSVKFSFLALFRKLVNRMPFIIKYWWFAVIFNVIVAIYGGTVYMVTCPYFRENETIQAMSCVQGAGIITTFRYSMSQMILDITGDLIILVIPTYLIWKIKIRVSQKIALFFSLCLTIVMIGITIARIIGLKWSGMIDVIWEIFFTILAGEIGLTLVAVVAFRTLFGAEVNERRRRALGPLPSWLSRAKVALSDFLTLFSQSRGSRDCSISKDRNGLISNNIAQGTLTGLRTFIDAIGRERVVSSNSSTSATLSKGCEILVEYPAPTYVDSAIQARNEEPTALPRSA